MPTHYEVLGVARTATTEEIKRRFRDLARKWHPDVATSPDATERFKAINEAYRVLGNAQSRAQYDAELQLEAQRKAGPGRTPQTGRPRTEASHGTGGSKPRGQSSGPPRRPVDPSSPQRVHRMLHEAEIAMQRMQLNEAAEICRTVLRLDRRNATAHEILGDICSIRGNVEAALAHYTIAVQLDPRNSRLRAKFERAAAEDLARQHDGMATGQGSSPMKQALALIFGLGMITVVVATVSTISVPPTSGEWIPWDWTPAVFLGLPMAGAIAGGVCSYAGILRPARSELLVTSSSRRNRSVVPMGVILVLLSVACFWLAGLLYAAVAATQEALSRSILLAFLICAILVTMFAAVVQNALAPVLMFGGNMVFPAFVGAWALADRAHRP